MISPGRVLGVGVAIFLLGVGVFLYKIQYGTTQWEEKNTAGIAVSIYPLWYFTQSIVGDLHRVQMIIPAGAEPHDYELTPQNIIDLHSSSLLVVNGGGVEPWLADMNNKDGEGPSVVIAGQDLIRDTIGEDGSSIADPHVWLSPVLAQAQVRTIRDALIAIDPEHSNTYTSNADGLLRRLETLDGAYRTGLSQCTRRTFITSHAAFGYLANEYGIRQLSIAGVDPEGEPTPDDMAKIIAFAKKEGVNTIFFEELLGPKVSETIARETGASLRVLNPIEGLTADEIMEGKNYVTEMESNLLELRRALECT